MTSGRFERVGTLYLTGAVGATGASALDVRPNRRSFPMSEPERSPQHAHRVVVPILLALASLALFTGALAVWVNRQALNTDNWKTTSSKPRSTGQSRGSVRC